MSEERYDRQLRLKQFGPAGQQALAQSRILIVGAGGLGVPSALYLNSMGVGELGIIDGDHVELSNLHRQPLYTEKDIGKLKVHCISEFLKQQNQQTKIAIWDTFLHAGNALEIIGSYDLIIDATDNLETRYLLDDACLLLNKPWVYGALHGFEGQVSVFNYQGGPTYRCLFPAMPAQGEIPDCNTLGTLGILPAIVGSFQSLEAIKVLCNLKGILAGKLLIYEGLEQQSRTISFKRNPNRTPPKDLMAGKNALKTCFTGSASDSQVEFHKVKATKNALIIDVREVAEFATGALPAALNWPLSLIEEIHVNKDSLSANLLLSDFEEVLNQHNEAFLICKSGPRSRKACFLLKERFPQRNFYWISGGMRRIKVSLE